MDSAKDLVLAVKENDKSQIGYGLQKECEALVSHVMENMIKSQIPPLIADKKNEEESARHREEGRFKYNNPSIYNDTKGVSLKP